VIAERIGLRPDEFERVLLDWLTENGL